MKKFVIQWKSKVTGRAGKGTKLFDHQEGQSLVEELNIEYPQIQHELVESGPPGEAPPEPTPAEPQLASEPESEPAAHPEDRQPAPVH